MKKMESQLIYYNTRLLHRVMWACMCHTILCQDMLLSCVKRTDPAGSTLNSKCLLIFCLAASTWLVLNFAWSESQSTVAFQLLKLLSSGWYSLAQQIQEALLRLSQCHCSHCTAAFGRCRLQAIKSFVNALPLSFNIACVYQKDRPFFLILRLILDFKYN